MTGLLLLFCALVLRQPGVKLPSFREFRAAQRFTGTPAWPNPTGWQRRFESRIKEASRKGPNFAGSYTVASWGCGTSCTSFVVIGARDGVVYNGPFQVLGTGVPYRYEGGWRELEYKLDSRLLIVRGCPHDREDNCGTYYYEWTPPRWKVLRVVPHGPLYGRAP